MNIDFGKIISNSVKYPFRNIKKLPILFILFILISTIPIAWLSDNRYLLAFGLFSLFLFILIVPGYLFSMVEVGLNESTMFPSLSFGDTIRDSIRLLLLRMAYMIVPACVLFIFLSILSLSGANLKFDMSLLRYFFTLGVFLIAAVVVYILFEILLFFAKARLAYLNSLKEALKIHEVVRDIKTIGVINIIKWAIFMAVLMVAFTFISAWVMEIPYVGFLIYIGVVIPILESISNYSVGLLYSNITLKPAVR
ncbi:MAG: DUF4013 domain-containing protein [Methanobrevibacter sp.]|uniref:DUF4013 domain-containing protein n=1 Tax=Methanobrevibacter sp. TaxID=66852 RepID=UPI002E76B14B|nr:DUF4013 domain-containing protein [Methanobrevibacter sp.]MEE0901917.1 DUF4013 domain-containing protein [Methanobrevibacter sp.]MEE0934445.1 DUF4013 domain-containing protein [Methanobrevibacter sp.]